MLISFYNQFLIIFIYQMEFVIHIFFYFNLSFFIFVFNYTIIHYGTEWPHVPRHCQHVTVLVLVRWPCNVCA